MPEWQDITEINYLRMERVATWEMIKHLFYDNFVDFAVFTEVWLKSEWQKAYL